LHKSKILIFKKGGKQKKNVIWTMNYQTTDVNSKFRNNTGRQRIRKKYMKNQNASKWCSDSNGQ
jgi:hypothetical protein